MEMKENTSIRLKKIMEERNLRQVDIIKLCEPYCKKYNVKLTKNYLSQYVSGKVEPGQRTLSILAMALDVNEAWLMGFNVPRERDLLPQTEDSSLLAAIINNRTLRNSPATEEFLLEKLKENLKLSPEAFELLNEFDKLNSEGKKEAIKRIKELTFIPQYHEANMKMVTYPGTRKTEATMQTLSNLQIPPKN